MSSRRRFLASTATVLGAFAAGCSQSDNPRQVSFGERADGVAVTAAEHRHSVFYINIDAADVHAFDDQAVYAKLDAETADEPPAVNDVSLVADGASYEGEEPPGFFAGEPPYTAERGTGWIVFEVPCPLDTSDVRVETQGVAWQLPGDLRSALEEPAPTFELLDFDPPESVSTGESLEASLTVRRTGGPGPLRLAWSLHAVGSPDQELVTKPVPRGTAQTVFVTFDGHQDAPDGVEEVRLDVDSADFEARVDIPLDRS